MHISHELLTTWGSNSAGVVTKIQTSRKFDRIQLVGKQPQDIHQMAEAYYKSLSASMRTGIKWIVKGSFNRAQSKVEQRSNELRGYAEAIMQPK
ncbi:hypothetical protein AFCA_012179 [Aspergillus flavus]|nr:hypothetical protein AFCA_012179 [Aspergillus flavus]